MTRHLDALDRAMRRAHAWRLLPLLSGLPSDKQRTFNLRKTLADFVGPRSAIRVRDLLGAELGIIAPSWRELGNAVWLVRPRDKRVLGQWFPARRRHLDSGASSGFFATETGLIVCVKDDIAAMVRRTGTASALAETMLLMAGRNVPVLETDRMFQELMAHLPARPLAVAYLRPGTDKSPAAAGARGIETKIDRAVVGLYEGDGRLDIAFRAALVEPRSSHVLSEEAIEHLIRLPQTTLLAAALTVDVEPVANRAIAEDTSMLHRALMLLRGLGSASAAEGRLPSSIGPQVLLVWDQDLRPSGSTPQIAVMAQCGDIRAALIELEDIAGNALKLVTAVDSLTPDAMPAIEHASHLGTPISSISLKGYAAKSRFPLARLLAHVEPAWASVGDWLVLALSRDHIERILDAHRGLAPTLGGVPDVKVLASKRVKRTMLTIVQADLAADIMRQWLSDLKAGAPSLLNPAWWEDVEPKRKPRRRLGIGMKAQQEPGVVTVARVYPGTAAAGNVRPGDRIIGIDGQLLDLAAPNADLRRRWAMSRAEPSHILRVLRGDTTVELVLAMPKPRVSVADLPVKPAEALRELASLATTLEFASFASYESEEARYSGRLSLRFVTTPTRQEP